MSWDNLLKDFGKIQPTEKQAVKAKGLIVDNAENGQHNRSAIFQEQAIASDAMALLSEWFETMEDDLDDGEGLGDRLYSLFISLADENKDGEISDDEADVINIGINAAYDYLVSKGVSEENATALLEEFDNAVAESVHAFVLEKLPVGNDEMFNEMDDLIFADAENEPMLDGIDHNGLALDAAYRKTFAIRHGKKMRINKRISGKVRLSAKQKIAIKKARLKANTGAAKMRRLKSFRLHKRMIG